MIYAATGEEGIGNGYLPRDASGHQQAGYLRGCGGLYAYAQMHAADAGTRATACRLSARFMPTV